MKVKRLESKLDGKTDKTHKIIEEKDETTKETEYLQYEFKADPNCKINRLGFTLEEVEKIIKEAESNKLKEMK